MSKQYTLNILAAAGLALMATVALNAGTVCSRDQAGDRPCCLDLIEKHQSRGWLGIDKEIRTDGTYAVTAVSPDGPAPRADLRVGDVIRWIDGIHLTPETNARNLPSQRMIGRTIAIGVQRGADQLILFIEPVTLPEEVLTALQETHRKQHDSN